MKLQMFKALLVLPVMEYWEAVWGPDMPLVERMANFSNTLRRPIDLPV
jgi:hypothetical protein